MEGEFPTNSRKQKAQSVEPKKVERVIEGEVVRRKKPLGRRMKETFIGGDARSVWGVIALDVLIPSAKDMFADAITQGIERMIWPDARPSSRRSGRYQNQGHIAYNRMSSSRREEPRRQEISRRGRANFNFDEIILPTRVEAEEVIDRMFDLVAKYETATVADLYDLCGIESKYTDDKWGWVDIRGAGITRVSGGYLLDVPRPEPLD